MKHLNNLIFIDLETVSQRASFDDLSEKMQVLWLKKAAFLRNETESSLEELYFEKAGIYAEYGQIICISLGFVYFDNHSQPLIRIKGLYDNDEKTLLEKFVDTISAKFDEKKVQLCAHNGKEFDFPYLSRRMIVNGMSLPFYLDLSGKKPWEINHIDTLEMWKFGDRKAFTSLDLLTAIFGIPSPKQDIDGSQVNHVFHKENDIQRISKYCNHDILATAQVYLKLKGLDRIREENVHVV